MSGRSQYPELTFPNSLLEMTDTALLFSVNTLQYLLLTAIGFTCNNEKQSHFKNQTLKTNPLNALTLIVFLRHSPPGTL
jgi:hypothetical protein